MRPLPHLVSAPQASVSRSLAGVELSTPAMSLPTFISVPLPTYTARRPRLRIPLCSATPPPNDDSSPSPSSDASWQVLQRRLALLRDKEVIRDRTIARNWRSGKYYASVVAAVTRDYVRKLSLEGDFLAMGTASGGVVFSDLVSGRRVTCPHVHTGQVTAIHYCDSYMVSAGASDCEVAVWQTARYEKRSLWDELDARGEAVDGVMTLPKVRIKTHTDQISALRLDVKNSRVYSASIDGTVRVSHLDTGEEISMIRVGEPVLSMTLTEKGYLLVGSTSGRVLAYQAERGLHLLSMVCHDSNTTALAFWEETQVLVTGDAAGNLKVWSFNDSTLLGTLPKHEAAVMSVQIDSSKVVTSSRDGSVAVFGLASRQRLYSIVGFTKYLGAATFDDVRLVADGTNDFVICHRFDSDEGAGS